MKARRKTRSEFRYVILILVVTVLTGLARGVQDLLEDPPLLGAGITTLAAAGFWLLALCLVYGSPAVMKVSAASAIGAAVGFELARAWFLDSWWAGVSALVVACCVISLIFSEIREAKKS